MQCHICRSTEISGSTPGFIAGGGDDAGMSQEPGGAG